jgi:hypothetical protein
MSPDATLAIRLAHHGVRRCSMKVRIGNLAPGTTAEKVEQLLEKYGLPQPERMVPLPDGAMPAMIVEFKTDDVERLRKLIWRIEGLYWEGRRIIATPLRF